MDKKKFASEFHTLSVKERLAFVQQTCHLSDEEVALLGNHTPLSVDLAENLIENVVGYFQMPMGIATNFKIDGRELLIPMVVEETSIIAAASATAKWVKKMGGEINTGVIGHQIIGQIQLPHVIHPEKVVKMIAKHRNEIIGKANDFFPNLVKRGGGVEDIVVRPLERDDGNGTMVVIHLLCNPCDAMGANLINQVCEAIKPTIESITGERVGICILSNLVDGKRVFSEVVLNGIEEPLGTGIQEASIFAATDPYRAATHNKGVMNGIDSILLATGNDWRAVSAGVHAFAARSGKYRPITEWKYSDGELRGRIEIPLAVGTVGGATTAHPIARIALKILGVKKSEELARICASVGLVQNLGALKALSTVGIVQGHMRLHSRNLASAAGATVHEMKDVTQYLRQVLEKEKRVSLTHAKDALTQIRKKSRKG